MFRRTMHRLCSRGFHNVSKQGMLFEGNTKGIASTPEERMTRVFGGRLKGESPKSTSRIIVSQNKKIAGVDVPARPPLPDNCCMSGCVNCVWELYNDDVRYWKRLRKEAVKNISQTEDIWPEEWDPPLALLEMKNVPPNLRDRKVKLYKENIHEIKTREDVKSLFPKRQSPLPKQVLQAKKRNTLLKESQEPQDELEDDEEDEGWADIPVYIKVFAEFERKKRLIKKERKLKRRRALLEQLKTQEDDIAIHNNN